MKKGPYPFFGRILPMPTVLVTCKLPSSVLAKLESAAVVDLYAGEPPMPPTELRARLADTDALVCLLIDAINRTVIDAGQKLKIVANIAVGYNNIDLAHARSRGVVVTNTPDVLTESVANFTWAMILAMTRRLPEGERLVRRGQWRGWALDFMLGSELRGKQLGLVGWGRIARAVAARAPAFGMRIAYTSRREADVPTVRRSAHADAVERASGSPEPKALGVGPQRRKEVGPHEHWKRISLDQLLSTSDVVSLHVPLTPETRHLIDKRALARMKRSAYLVNTARGPVVDEAALAWALQQHLIAGAALDVYENEPAIHPDLLKLESVLLAPHLGSATTETRTAMADLAVENVLAVLAGKPPLTPVTA